MKKKMAMLLAAILTLSMFAGCGSKEAETTASASGTTAAAQETEAPADTGETYEWSMGTIYSDPTTSTTYNAFGESAQKFCDLVAEYTNGRVTVTPFYDSVLGGAADLYDQTKTNEIQVCYCQPMSTIDSRYGVTSIPGMFGTYEDVKEKFCDPESELFQLMNTVLAEDGVTMLSNNMAVFRVFYNSKQEVKVPSDLEGMVVRIYEDTICETYWSGLCGASVIPYSEMFMSLQTGVVDGAEHTMSAGPSQLYQVTPYCSDINWQWTWGGPIIVNQEALAELPADLQEAVKKAAVDAAEFYNEIWEGYNSECQAAMEEQGMTFTTLTDAERAEWVAYGESLSSKLASLVGEDFYNQVKDILSK